MVGCLLPFVQSVLLEPDVPTARVTGALNPDSTGDYPYVGQYNGQPYYENLAGYKLFCSLGGDRVICESFNYTGGYPFWVKAGCDVPGTYIPVGGASGDATVVLLT